MNPPRSCWITALLGLICATAHADVATLTPSKDNTLYESLSGSLSNGTGTGMFVGKTAGRTPAPPPELRRGLLMFDVAADIPSGAAIDSVKLTLLLTRTQLGTSTLSIHRVLADWGEGTSNAGEPRDGDGALSTVGDATWIHRAFNSTFWSMLGGDFEAAASGSTDVGGLGYYTWGTTEGMVADVQGWLDDPSTNFGWIVVGDEVNAASAKRFSTRESMSEADRPKLDVYYTPGMVPVDPTSWGAIKRLYR